MTPTLWAALWMFGALASFLTMGVSGRELSAELSVTQILFFRSVIGLMIVATALQRSGWAQVRTDRLRLHLVRNVVHFGGQYCWFFGIALLPLAQVFAIEFTAPIWTAIFAPLLLGEKLTLRRGLAIAIGFAGILIILRPGLVPVNTASMVVLAAAMLFALSATLVKKLTAFSTPLAIIFYMTVIQLPMGFIPALDGWVWPSQAMWPWLLIVSFTALSAHYCMARAFAHADALVVFPMDFMRVPAVAVVGLVVYGEALDWWVLAGAAVILAGIVFNLMGERRWT